MIIQFDESVRRWVAAGRGYLKPIVAEGHTRKMAWEAYGAAVEEQKGQEYALEQQMTALSLQNDPDGRFK